jgi:hypothetical protein
VLQKPKEFWKALAARADQVLANSIPIPRTLSEALSWDANWRPAVQAEYDALLAQSVFRLVPRSSLAAGTNIVGSKLVFDVKSKADGSVERYKVRMVAQGFSQVEGVDFTETYAPVLRMTTFRLAMAIAAHRHYFVDQIDVNTAFLNSVLREKVFIKLPPGYSDFVDSSVDSATHVLQLLKSLYGLKQAGRDWHKTLHAALTEMGFARATIDKCVYSQTGAAGYFIVLVFVDDLVTVAERESDRDAFFSDFRSRFKTKEPRPLDLFLGINVCYDRLAGAMVLKQQTYVASMLKRFGLQAAYAQYVPAAPDRLTKADCPSSDQVDPAVCREYQQIVASCLYAVTCTRPDIAFAVSQCASFNANPGPSHMAAARRILRFLKGTSADGIGFNAASEYGLDLIGFADSDWAGDSDTRRSTGGYVFVLAGGAVSWSSKLQRVVALSSSEAEFISIADAVAEAKYLRALLSELGCPQQGPTTIFEDNQGCIFMAKNDAFGKRTKHIDVKWQFAQEAVAEGIVSVKYMHTGEMPADCLTKPLGLVKLQDCRAKIMAIADAEDVK